MDQSSNIAIEMLAALSNVEKRMRDIRSHLCAQPSVVTTTVLISHSRLRMIHPDNLSFPAFHAYTDATLKSGDSLSWNVELELYDERAWHVLHSVEIAREHAEYPEKLIAFPDISCTTFPDLLEAIDQSLTSLVASAHAMNFDAPEAEPIP